MNPMRPAAILFALAITAVPLVAQESAPTSRRQSVNWTDRHQEDDGSWSPADFVRRCRPDKPCTGVGKESFRVAATALFALNLVNAGYFGRDETDSPAHAISFRAIRFLVYRQREDGSFAAAGDPAPGMTNACATIALCRAERLFGERHSLTVLVDLTSGRRRAVESLQGWLQADPEFEKAADAPRRLSTAVWTMLALRAAAESGFKVDRAMPDRVLAWIEKVAAVIEAGAGTVAAEARIRAHARASLAVARLSTGASVEALIPDLEWLLRELNRDATRALDAETILFTSFLQSKCRQGDDPGWRVIKKLVVDTQAAASDGCAEGTWSTPTIWSDLGGRLASTAFMGWALEIYYRYPDAMWVGE
jgi:hypothetical protein